MHRLFLHGKLHRVIICVSPAKHGSLLLACMGACRQAYIRPSISGTCRSHACMRRMCMQVCRYACRLLPGQTSRRGEVEHNYIGWDRSVETTAAPATACVQVGTSSLQARGFGCNAFCEACRASCKLVPTSPPGTLLRFYAFFTIEAMMVSPSLLREPASSSASPVIMIVTIRTGR